MSFVTRIGAAVALLLIGPSMYVVSRAHSLELAFSRVRNGDSVTTLAATMGAPQAQGPGDPHLSAEIEYRYWVWPLPRTWVVGLKDGKVVEKMQLKR
jgi:hypothetical protein